MLSRISLTFGSLIIMCLCVDVFEFILLGVHWAWACRLMFFIIFGVFSAIIFSDILSAPYSLSLLSFWDSHYVWHQLCFHMKFSLILWEVLRGWGGVEGVEGKQDQVCEGMLCEPLGLCPVALLMHTARPFLDYLSTPDTPPLGCTAWYSWRWVGFSMTCLIWNCGQLTPLPWASVFTSVKCGWSCWWVELGHLFTQWRLLVSGLPSVQWVWGERHRLLG